MVHLQCRERLVCHRTGNHAPAFTWAKSRTRRSIRLAIRGVPRERQAISIAPSDSIGTSSRPCRPGDDLRQLLRCVELQAQGYAEAVPQGRESCPARVVAPIR